MIDEYGKNLGIMETPEALKTAQERNLDLIEIAPTARPPVAKIMDFGKFKYEHDKGEREHGKKQKEGELKGIRIGFTTGKHDLALRAKQIEKFLKEGDKVRLEMRLKGREKAHRNLAFQRFNDFLSLIPAEFTLEMPPKKLPQGFVAVISKKS